MTVGRLRFQRGGRCYCYPEDQTIRPLLIRSASLPAQRLITDDLIKVKPSPQRKSLTKRKRRPKAKRMQAQQVDFVRLISENANQPIAKIEQFNQTLVANVLLPTPHMELYPILTNPDIALKKNDYVKTQWVRNGDKITLKNH